MTLSGQGATSRSPGQRTTQGSERSIVTSSLFLGRAMAGFIVSDMVVSVPAVCRIDRADGRVLSIALALAGAPMGVA